MIGNAQKNANVPIVEPMATPENPIHPAVVDGRANVPKKRNNSDNVAAADCIM